MKTWIISDTHLGHVKIRDYEPMRQSWGPDHTAMTETLINAWNDVVGVDDHVYHLGDFAMGLPTLVPVYRYRLHGRITLIRGNHDKKPHIWLNTERGDVMYDHLVIRDPHLGTVTMRHDPNHFTQEDVASSSLLLHGHIHSNPYGSEINDDVLAKCRCVSVEVLPFCPKPFPFADVSSLPVGTLRGKWTEPNHRHKL